MHIGNIHTFTVHIASHIMLFTTYYTPIPFFLFFFFNDTATTEIYTLSLHDALPIYPPKPVLVFQVAKDVPSNPEAERSEEHTSELQSRENLVCRLLLEKKKKKIKITYAKITKVHKSVFTHSITALHYAYES